MRVVGRPHVERRHTALDHAVVIGGEVIGDLGPGSDPYTVGLGDAPVLEQRPRGRLLVGPDALLEGATKLWMMGLADQVVALVVEGRIEEELVVLDLEVLVVLAGSRPCGARRAVRPRPAPARSRPTL